MNTPKIGTVIKTEPLTAAAADIVVHTHGAELRPFAAMLARYGKNAARDVELLHRILSATTTRMSEARLAQGWDAVTRLASRARKLPTGPDRTAVEHELQQAMQSLLSRETDFVVPFTEDVAAKATKAREARRLRALKTVGISLPPPTGGTQTLVQLARDLDAGAPALRQLWLHFSSTPGAGLTQLRAAERAAKLAPAIDATLRSRGLTSAASRRRLWGYLVQIRGLLGEGYALGSSIWRETLAAEMARARRLARHLGPGHTVEYLTQLDHGLRLNGPEGPDAIVAIISRHEKVIYDPMRAQVKVARTSEAAAQSANDVLRRVGLEKRRELASSWYEFRRAPSGHREVYMIRSRPDVSPNLFLINAAGGRTPRAELARLKALNLPTTEIWLDMTIDQITHLAISMVESALKVSVDVP